MKTSNTTLALFDFDGTLTRGDTFIYFLQFTHGYGGWLWRFAILLPVLVAFKLHLIPNQKAKEWVLSFFYKGVSAEQMRAWGQAFMQQKLPLLLRPQGLQRLKEHQAAQHRVILVSASCEEWLLDWCAFMRIECISSRLAYTDNRFTGRLQGPNCYGAEKVNRINAWLDVSGYDEIYAYGDSRGDREMLAMSTHPHYKPFRN